MSRDAVSRDPVSREVASLVARLEAWVREETGAQRRLAAELARQEAAVVASDAAALAAATAALERELGGADGRERRRRELVGGLAAAWGVAADALSLGSIAERAGAGGDRLATLRAELRDATAEVARRGRRIAVLAHHHGALLDDVLRTLAAGDPARGGSLVNAEA